MNREFRERLYAFTVRLIRFVDSLPRDQPSRRMADQLFRSGTSIIANLTEGEAGSSRRDFANYVNHALKSARESLLWMSLLKDSGRISNSESDWLRAELDQICRILNASLRTLRTPTDE